MTGFVDDDGFHEQEKRTTAEDARGIVMSGRMKVGHSIGGVTLINGVETMINYICRHCKGVTPEVNMIKLSVFDYNWLRYTRPHSRRDYVSRGCESDHHIDATICIQCYEKLRTA